MNYITTAEAAEKWHISARRVQVLCKQCRIEGAVYKGVWLIPDTSQKPEDPRKCKNTKTANTSSNS